MKGSNAIFAKGKTTLPADRPSASSRTPTAKGFALAGRSETPDPATHAYRQDLADVALAGRVIASHYAEPVARTLNADSVLLAHPRGEPVGTLSVGDRFDMLDCTLGWAWGYAGPDRLVGYVSAEALS